MKWIAIFAVMGMLIMSCNETDQSSQDTAVASGLQTEKMTDSYENGRPKVISKFKDGEVIYERHYYETGGVIKEGPIKNGNRDGKWQSFYPSGKLQSIGHYVDGKRQDIVETYYENGNLRYEGKFENGKKAGSWVFYDESGKVTKTEKY